MIYASRPFRLAGGGVVLLESTNSRRRIRPWCREVLAAGCHGAAPEYVGANFMREVCGNRIAVMALARDELGVVGWAWVASHRLAAVWVEERCRRRGLGGALLGAVLAIHGSDGVWARSNTLAGAALYRALGVGNWKAA